MSEIPLVGGDVNIGENVVVRVGETVRRPLSDRAPAVHALLRHFEAVGFEGAPRVLGIDERGRETLSWPNVVFRGELPVALIDWDLAAPAPRVYDVASAANFWAPLWPDEKALEWGLPSDRRGIRLRLLCDAYGLGPDERLALLDVVAHRRRIGCEIHRRWGGIERRPGWAEMWDAGSGDEILARNTWFEAVRDDLLAFLR